MSQENVEFDPATPSRRITGIGCQDCRLRDYWHPDIEWERLAPWAIALGGQTHWRGREQAIANFAELESLLGHFMVEVLDTAVGRRRGCS